ncbi:cell division cycle protein 123 homolog isoform X3 [Ostrea edulis]|uniref:cell division cycle protein 123 homolog isoform X3 n=1 Tax=Ostrea edulis TaxID=37623 RepID=UPI0024AFE63E|nr:cell division cycle protein 123 homolog isoform X3 [Ostrea edulis]
MKISEVLHCSFPVWYPKFKHISIKSILIPLPGEFLEYLHTDGVVLPEGCLVTSEDRDSDEDRVGEELDVDWDSDTVEATAPSFPEFDAAIKKAIKMLGGKVFPKLNWSSPRDATWIAFDKSLKCTCPSDVYLLLKSSEFITHDLTQPFIQCEDFDERDDQTDVGYSLILRRWQDLNPGYEFRCFVRMNTLIAICQRNHTAFYDFIRHEKEDIVSDIRSFFYHMIHLKFPNESYVFDVYRRDQGKLLLLDFNPFGVVTDGLMFTWDELTDSDTNLRGTDNETQVNIVDQTNTGRYSGLSDKHR